MTILVDDPVWPAHGRLWAHLVSDASVDELHAFAAAHGIPRRAFDLDHYDVPADALPRLVEGGATRVGGKELTKALIASGLRVTARERVAREGSVELNRLEAFSDGVLAIIITVMVLGLAVPAGHTWGDLLHTSGLGLLTYLLSFVYIGIYWNNHHHLFQLRPSVSGGVLWANLHLLFWLSLYPFTTAWLTESRVALVPTIVYGLNLLAAGVAYYVLQEVIARRPGGERLREAFGHNVKGIVSPILYLAGIGLAFITPWLGLVPFIVVAVMWLVPDRRVERYLTRHPSDGATTARDDEDPAP